MGRASCLAHARPRVPFFTTYSRQRSSQTQTRSRAQVIGGTAKLTMVRLALRALDAEERHAAVRERELVAAVEDERRRQAYQQQRYADGLRAVRLALRADDEVEFDDTIERKGLVSLAEAALADAMRTDLPKPATWLDLRPSKRAQRGRGDWLRNISSWKTRGVLSEVKQHAIARKRP